MLYTADNIYVEHFVLIPVSVVNSYLSELVVRQRLVVLPSEARDILLVAVSDVASRSNLKLVLGDG